MEYKCQYDNGSGYMEAVALPGQDVWVNSLEEAIDRSLLVMGHTLIQVIDSDEKVVWENQ